MVYSFENRSDRKDSKHQYLNKKIHISIFFLPNGILYHFFISPNFLSLICFETKKNRDDKFNLRKLFGALLKFVFLAALLSDLSVRAILRWS